MGDYIRAERALENVSLESVKRLAIPEVDAARYYEILGAANGLSGRIQTSVHQLMKSVSLTEKGTEVWSRRIRDYTEACPIVVRKLNLLPWRAKRRRF